jgi:hypothetical protein
MPKRRHPLNLDEGVVLPANFKGYLESFRAELSISASKELQRLAALMGPKPGVVYEGIVALRAATSQLRADMSQAAALMGGYAESLGAEDSAQTGDTAAAALSKLAAIYGNKISSPRALIADVERLRTELSAIGSRFPEFQTRFQISKEQQENAARAAEVIADPRLQDLISAPKPPSR